MGNMFVFTKRERERERERLFVSYIYLTLLFIFVFAAVMPVSGEGSREINADGNSSRSQLRGSRHYVYLKPGEKLYIGSSTYIREDYDVSLTTPDGTLITYDIEENGNGYIANRAQEMAGPKPLNSSGYTPITYTAPAEGIYSVVIRTNDDDKRYCYSLSSVDWNSLSCKTSYTFSWDITVSSSAGNRIDGRVFAPILFFSAQGPNMIGVDSGAAPLNTSVYVLTDNGYQYKVTLKNVFVWGYSLRFSNMGNIVNNHSAYTSYFQGSSGYPNFLRSDFNRQSNGGVMYRTFYNLPDTALLQYLGYPANGNPITCEISNFEFHSTSNLANKEYSGEGGIFNFDSSVTNGKYTFTLSFANGKNIVRSGQLSANNSISWDGKDNEGNVVESGEITASIDLIPGETHFVLDDFEQITDGIVIERLNGSSSNRYKVYYDHTPQSVDGYYNNLDTVCDGTNYGGTCPIGYTTKTFTNQNRWVVDADDTSVRYLYGNLSNLDGVDSSGGASITTNYFSDHKSFDLWAYDDAAAPTSINIKVISNEKINIQVNKHWEDDSNRDGVRPSTISVKLLQNEIEYDTAAITGSSSNTWTYTFRNLPKYNTDGELFEYSVEEVVE